MNARELLARDLNAMLVNGKAEITTDGVRIVPNEEKCDATWNNPDWCDYWGVDNEMPTGSWDDEYF